MSPNSGASIRAQLALDVTPELYQQIRRLWIQHSIAEDKRDLQGLIDTLSEDCVYEIMPTGQRDATTTATLWISPRRRRSPNAAAIKLTVEPLPKPIRVPD